MPRPGIGVVLHDVVMETDHAGLEVSRAIRRELGNPLVRVLLRTGQPGVAPEQQTIDSYDIDGYLAKTETSASRLYTAVRCALKSYQELVTLERHRAYLAAAHDCAVSLQATMPVEQMLRRVLDAVLALCPAPLVLLELETFGAARRTAKALSLPRPPDLTTPAPNRPPKTPGCTLEPARMGRRSARLVLWTGGFTCRCGCTTSSATAGSTSIDSRRTSPRDRRSSPARGPRPERNLRVDRPGCRQRWPSTKLVFPSSGHLTLETAIADGAGRANG